MTADIRQTRSLTHKYIYFFKHRTLKHIEIANKLSNCLTENKINGECQKIEHYKIDI